MSGNNLSLALAISCIIKKEKKHLSDKDLADTYTFFLLLLFARYGLLVLHHINENRVSGWPACSFWKVD